MISEDLENELKLEDVLSSISRPYDRAHLLHFANQLFRVDELVKIEEDTFKNLEKKILGEVDLMDAVHQARLEIEKETEEKAEKHNNISSLFETLIDFYTK